MNTSHRITILVIVAATILAGCNLDTVNHYGDNCKDWKYIQSGDAKTCQSDYLDACSENFRDAYRAGKCPEHFPSCTFNEQDEKICTTICPSSHAPKMCNGNCISEAAYALALRETKDGNEYCQSCPIECLETCDPETRECPAGSVECPAECVNGCNASGTCKCDISCPNGCDATGASCCMEKCQNGCTSGGVCLCPKGCANGCDASGKACCPEMCKNGCDLDGVCSCPVSCVKGCNDDGSCIPSEGCQNGVTETGACKCPDACQNGCDPQGTVCTCPFTCIGGCDKAGASCTCEADCVEGSQCDKSTGKCTCIDNCKYGCDDTGSCDAACENVECKGSNEQCQKGECIDLCKDITCDNKGEYCRLGKCMSIDANHNHMHDQYETSAKQNQTCRKYADCDSEPGKGDGFCDSFIDYKCSTKCTSDEQCIDDGEYHYICRPDGRCAPDVFVTVWEIPNDRRTLTLSTSLADYCDFTIDWGDDSKEVMTCSKQNSNCKDMSHTYASGGQYTIKIKGTYDGFGWTKSQNSPYDFPVYPGKDKMPSKLVAVKAFGPVGLSYFAFAFCQNLKSLSSVDIPDATKMQNMNHAFCDTGTFNLPLAH